MSYRNYYDVSYSTRVADRPKAVTAKYTSITPSYKSSSIPILNRERSATRENDTPISKIASKYSNHKTKDDIPKYTERKDAYNRLTVPSNSKSREPSPVSNSSRYNLNKSPRPHSPETRNLITPTISKSRSRDPSPKEKDIPSKTEKSSYVNNYTGFKLYPRSSSSYTKTISRIEPKADNSLSRYSIGNRFTNSYIRGNSGERSFPSISNRNNINENEKDTKCCNGNISCEENKEEIRNNFNDINGDDSEEKFETITVITRHTSPTPPGSSVYVRTRRADMAKTTENTIIRSNKRPRMLDKEIQSDRNDDAIRNGRFSSSSRAGLSTWSPFNLNANKYCGYAGRYSTQYASREIPENSRNLSPNEQNANSSRLNTKSTISDTNTSTTNSQMISNPLETISTEDRHYKKEMNEEQFMIIKEIENNETPEIVINVNLKLKKATPNCGISSEMVSPEVTITNSQLPPQPPKVESTIKLKKKVKKTSSENSSEPKKKVIKRRKSSSSSIESDTVSDRSSAEKTLPSKDMTKSPSSSSISSLQNVISDSNLHVSTKHSNQSPHLRGSNSPDSITTNSTHRSSDDEFGSKSKFSKSNDLSRTSADEMSIPSDKSEKFSPINHQSGDHMTDDAKSFLIRALAPATNIFKLTQYDSENTSWLESTSESTSKDAPDLKTESESLNNKSTECIQESKLTLKPLRRIESAERSWWLEPENNELSSQSSQNTKSITSSADKRNARKISKIDSGERAWWQQTNSENNSVDTEQTDNYRKSQSNGKVSKHNSEEKPWWLDSKATTPEGIERLTPPRTSDSENSPRYDFYKVRHIDSGEKEWWHTSDSNSKSKDSVSHSNHSNQNQSKSSTESPGNYKFHKIRHAESGEKPWWLSSNKNIPEGIQKLPTPSPPPESANSFSDEVQMYVVPNKIPSFPLTLPDDEPLGDRRSPEGLETPREDEHYRHRSSPYENLRFLPPHPSFAKQSGKFSPRVLDIDDIFGSSGQMYSPFLDAILARRTGHQPFDEDLSDCQEIDATQVRIHDSTPQHPVIKKLRSRSEIIDCRDEDQLDEAAIQLYKTEGNGRYLALTSTAKECELELNNLEQNSTLVLRTKPVIRVKAMIEQLRLAEGYELRKCLFGLKEVLIHDGHLVYDFVENSGLDCLLSIGYNQPLFLEHVLRAVGQVVLCLRGDENVIYFRTTIEFLYTLLDHQLRHIVKNSLKILVIISEYCELNVTILVDTLNSVDEAQGLMRWETMMKIMKKFEADTELLIYMTTLLNKCLVKIASRDSYYDQIDSLEDLGFSEIVAEFIKKRIDYDLVRQFKLYDAVLSYEDDTGSEYEIRKVDPVIADSIKERKHSMPTDIYNRKSKRFYRKEADGKENKRKCLRRRRERLLRQTHQIIEQHELKNKDITLPNISSIDGSEKLNEPSPSTSSQNQIIYNTNEISLLAEEKNHIDIQPNVTNILKYIDQTSTKKPTSEIEKNRIHKMSIDLLKKLHTEREIKEHIQSNSNVVRKVRNEAIDRLQEISARLLNNVENNIKKQEIRQEETSIYIKNEISPILKSTSLSGNNQQDGNNTINKELEKIGYSTIKLQEEIDKTKLISKNLLESPQKKKEDYENTEISNLKTSNIVINNNHDNHQFITNVEKKDKECNKTLTIVEILKVVSTENTTEKCVENDIEAKKECIQEKNTTISEINMCDNIYNNKRKETENVVNQPINRREIIQQRRKSMQNFNLNGGCNPIDEVICILKNDNKKYSMFENISSNDYKVNYSQRNLIKNPTEIQLMPKRLNQDMSINASNSVHRQEKEIIERIYTKEPRITGTKVQEISKMLFKDRENKLSSRKENGMQTLINNKLNIEENIIATRNKKFVGNTESEMNTFSQLSETNFEGIKDNTLKCKLVDSHKAKELLEEGTEHGVQDNDMHGFHKFPDSLEQSIDDIPLENLPYQKSSANGLLLITKKIINANGENAIQDATINNQITSSEEGQTRVAEMTGLIMKAKEGISKSQNKETKSPPMPPKPQISENEKQWNRLRENLKRPFHICDLDFSDLIGSDENNVSSISSSNTSFIPPPPLPPPPMFNINSCAPPPPPIVPPPFCPPAPKMNLSNSFGSNDSSGDDGSIKKNKKTVKLFWKEINSGPLPGNLKQVESIWDALPNVNLDTAVLEHLFESRSNDLMIKKLSEPKTACILDAKRSNAINIGMKKLPTPDAIKTAVMKMDATVIGREGIEKLLTMLPTEEEKVKITEAQYANPDLPLGNAEQFLLVLSSITELPSRLKLWLFKLDFENTEKEIAEPLMDLKMGIELLQSNTTFKAILATLRSVGSFLNGTQAKGFRLEYLSKVMEVKDTVNKHPLLYHICEMIIQKFPESSDFFSEVGPVIRASKVDFDVIKQNLQKLEADCKSSWDHLKKVAKHDGQMIAKTKMDEFLTDAAERIILLGIIEDKIMHRYHSFLLFIRVPPIDFSITKPTSFLKIISEFALEYMTCRERVLQQLEKKANHRERNKMRERDQKKQAMQANRNTGDVAADAALRELLLTDEDSSPVVRKKMNMSSPSSNSDALATPDQVLESMVKSSYLSQRKPRERRRRPSDHVLMDRSKK